MFEMDLEYNKGILFARMSGYLTKNNSSKINNYLVPVILKHKIKYLVYNLFELKKIDERGVQAILNTKCAIKTNKGKIYLCEVSNEVGKSLKHLHIKQTDDEKTALLLMEA